EDVMDQLDDLLAEFFDPSALAPPGLGPRLARSRMSADAVAADVARFHLEATDRGLRRVRYGAGRDHAATTAARRHLARARAELAEYLAGVRTFFSVPVDLGATGEFQRRCSRRRRRSRTARPRRTRSWPGRSVI